jgi:hypothetical protein
MSQTKPTSTKRKRRRQSAPSAFDSMKTQLILAVICPMIVYSLMSVFTWVAFRATVLTKLDALTVTVTEIQKNVMPRDQISDQFHGITDRLGADEHNTDELRTQLHDDELTFAKRR